MGRTKMDGWVRKVLSTFECQVKIRAMMRPGNRTTANMRKNVRRRLPLAVASNGTIINFPSRVRREAKMRRRNLHERRLPTGRMLENIEQKGLKFGLDGIGRMLENIEQKGLKFGLDGM